MKVRTRFETINKIVVQIAAMANHLADVTSPEFCLMIAKIAKAIMIAPIIGSTSNDEISAPIRVY